MPQRLHTFGGDRSCEKVYTIRDFCFPTDPPVIDPNVVFGWANSVISKNAIYIPQNLNSTLNLTATLRYTVAGFAGAVAIQPTLVLFPVFIGDIIENDGLPRLVTPTVAGDLCAAGALGGIRWEGTASGSLLANGSMNTAVYFSTNTPDLRCQMCRHYVLAVCNTLQLVAGGTTITFNAINLFCRAR